MAKENKGTIIYGSLIVTCNENNEIFKDFGIYIKDGIIKELDSYKKLFLEHPKAEKKKYEGMVIFPGFVNTHIHSAQSIVRGVAEDLGRAPSYTSTVPQGDDLTESEAYVFSLLGAATALRFGSTTISDNYAHAKENAKAFEDLKIRAVVSERVHDMIFHHLASGTYIKDEVLGDELLQKNVDLLEKYQERDGLITACLGPHAADTCSDELLSKIGKLFEKYKVPITTHLCQSPQELARVREVYGKTSTEVLAECGLLNSYLCAAHGVFLSGREMDMLVRSKSHIIHIPEGNAKAGAIAPIEELTGKGLNVSISTDNGAGNMIENMRMALVSGRIKHGSVEFPKPETVLRMSTINGAKALHMEDKIGSLEVGKKADLVIVDYDSLHMTPAINIIGNLVHLGLGNDIYSVYVDGKEVVKDGHVTTIDEKEIMRDARKIAMYKWLKSSPLIDKEKIYVF